MTTRATRPRLSGAGFSLAEVLLAIVLLGLLAIGASALLTQLVGASDVRRSELLTETCSIAVMESLLTHDYSALATGSSNGTDPLGVEWTAMISQESPRLRRITVTADQDGETTRLETLISDRFQGTP